MSTLVRLDARQSREHWVRIRELLMPVVERLDGIIGLREIQMGLDRAWSQAWVAWDDGASQIETVVITRVRAYAEGELRVLELAWCGGKLEHALEHIEALEKGALEQGCSRVRIEGRRGWQRVFAGYHEVSRTLEKEI